MRKRIIRLPLLSRILLLVLMVSTPAFAQTTPPSTPTTKSTPKQIVIEIYSPPKGFTIYIISFAFAEMLNKRSSFIKASAVETLGGPDALYAIQKLPPERRKNAITLQQETEWPRAIKGLPPYTDPIPDLRMMMTAYEYGSTHHPITLDPKIKTYKDMIGKRVGTAPPGGGFNMFTQFVMKECWGIADKVKMEYMRFDGLKQALLNGLIDVAWMPSPTGPIGKYELSPVTMEIAAMKPIYFIPTEKEDLAKGVAQSYYKPVYVTIPKGSFGKNLPQEDLPSSVIFCAWFCWKDADPEVIHEIVRIHNQFGKDFDGPLPSMAGFAANKNMMGYSKYLKEEYMHPGAVKFFKENNLKIGIPD